VGLVQKVLMKDLLIGLRRTVTYNYQKAITMQYPKEKWTPYPRFRGVIRLTHDEEGNLKCIACGMCARACPVGCITVKTEGKGKERKLVDFVIDFGVLWSLRGGLSREGQSHRDDQLLRSSYLRQE